MTSPERDLTDRLLERAARGLSRDAEVLTGDDERIARMARAVQQRYAAPRRVAKLPRVKRAALGLAVGLTLAGAAFGALQVAGVWSGRAAQPATSSTPTRVLPKTQQSAPAASVEELPTVAPQSLEPEKAVPVASTSSAPGIATQLEPSARAPMPVPSAELSAAALFSAANKARMSGDVARAVQLSEQLLKLFPGSQQATATHLSLGIVRLQQGRAAQALQQFDAYLAHDDGSGAEALWGKAQALQRLGRASEERATLSQLLEKYPHSAYRSAAQKRLDNLQ